MRMCYGRGRYYGLGEGNVGRKSGDTFVNVG